MLSAALAALTAAVFLYLRRRPSARACGRWGLILNLVGTVFVASDGLMPVRLVYDRVPWVMPWKGINEGLATLESRGVLKLSENGFDQVIDVMRRFDGAVPESANLHLSTSIGPKSVAVHKCTGVGAVCGGRYFEQLASIAIVNSAQEQIPVCTSADLRTWVERYRLSWFVTVGLVIVGLGFLLQLIGSDGGELSGGRDARNVRIAGIEPWP